MIDFIMKQKNYILITIIISFLHSYMYSMETSYKIPNNYFQMGDGFLSREFEGDVELGNISYQISTKQYVIKSTQLRERTTCYSLFPSLQLSRAYSSFKTKGDVYRFVDITEADL